jgi:hypothetical protein
MTYRHDMVKQAFGDSATACRALTTTMQALASAQAATAQALYDHLRVEGKQERHLIGLQASMDQLGGVLRQWESLATRLTVVLPPPPAPQPHLARSESEGSTR